MAIPASNRFNIEASRPSFAINPDAPFAPDTMTYHGFAIQVDNAVIGRITEWTPQALDRDITPVYELNPRTWGQPVDQVPGKANTFTVAFGRAEVWGQEFEVALGENDPYTLLTNQNEPFSIDEVFLRGNQLYRVYRHLGCWFSSRTTDAFTGEGDGIVRISGEITFVNKVRLL